ncbi:MAG: hypothetical protein M3506_10470, partial [Chloroflexota bacterium]|nr:hypothetical protein [Chloroflexota bacterium]
MVTRAIGGRSRHVRSATILVLVVVAILTGAVVIGVLTGGLNVHGTEPSRDPIRMTSRASWEPTTLQERIDRSELIMEGIVGEPYPSRWNTQSGALPAGATYETVRDMNLVILTDYLVKVTEVLKGTVSESTVRVRVIGGKVEQDSYDGDRDAQLRPDERVVLLLTAEDTGLLDGGAAHYTTVYGPFAKYAIEDGQAVLAFGSEKLESLPAPILRRQVRDSR